MLRTVLVDDEPDCSVRPSTGQLSDRKKRGSPKSWTPWWLIWAPCDPSSRRWGSPPWAAWALFAAGERGPSAQRWFSAASAEV